MIANHPDEVTALIKSVPTLIANNPAVVKAILDSLPALIPKIAQIAASNPDLIAKINQFAGFDVVVAVNSLVPKSTKTEKMTTH